MFSSFSRRVVAAIALFSVMFGAGCTKGPDAATVAASQPKTLTIWSVVDDQDAYGEILQAYQRAHPHISIVYRKFRLEEYEDKLVNAMAEDRGPDIFLVHNTWISKYLPRITPMPATTKMVYRFVSGGMTNQTETFELRNEKSIAIREVREVYPDTVYKDMVRRINTAKSGAAPVYEDKVVALPLSVDTLAMFVNKDMLNAANIPVVPDLWDKFQATMSRLVKVDENGKIVQAGAALGTARNVERAGDILSVLMMQNGTQMSADDGTPTFAMMPEALSATRQQLPAAQALRFYLDFANPDKDIYSWNADMPNSLDAFVQGRLAYFFGYSYHLPLIKSLAPKLNLTIAKLPQIEDNPTVNFANYWAWTVSKKSKNSDIAWNLINYMAKPENETLYLTKAQRPAAHKSLIEGQLEDENLAVFASQILTSRSWYRGADPATAEEAMMSLIEEGVKTPDEDFPQLLKLTQQKVDQTMDAQ